jgi:hypothetical protein
MRLFASTQFIGASGFARQRRTFSTQRHAQCILQKKCFSALKPETNEPRSRAMIGPILLILLILLLLGAFPAWPHSRSWGYGPSGGLGLILVIVLILVLLRVV